MKNFIISEPLKNEITNYMRGSMSTTHTIAASVEIINALIGLPEQKEDTTKNTTIDEERENNG